MTKLNDAREALALATFMGEPELIACAMDNLVKNHWGELETDEKAVIKKNFARLHGQVEGLKEALRTKLEHIDHHLEDLLPVLMPEATFESIMGSFGRKDN